jgi:hypothetical protein
MFHELACEFHRRSLPAALHESKTELKVDVPGEYMTGWGQVAAETPHQPMDVGTTQNTCMRQLIVPWVSRPEHEDHARRSAVVPSP